MWNARLDESSWNQDCQEKHQQPHADDTILMAESEEELAECNEELKASGWW